MSKPTLLVLAAGMGSRYGGLKQMEGVGPRGETLLDFAVAHARAAGFGRVVFVIRRDFAEAFQRAVVDHLPADLEVDLVYQEIGAVPSGRPVSMERLKPWGTGHAVLAARAIIRDPFVVINADDFYGADAYRQAAAFIDRMLPSQWPLPLALVAFQLGRTLSPHGPVSRGVCAVDDKGFLERVEETSGLSATAGGEILAEGRGRPDLTLQTPVSMNFFVFVPQVFDFLQDQFRQFLEQRGGDPEAEFYLPAALSAMIERNQAKISVLESSEAWMGVTYPEDRSEVEARLAERHARGGDPSPLW